MCADRRRRTGPAVALDAELTALLDEHDLDPVAIEELHHQVSDLVSAEVAEVADLLASGHQPIPDVDHDTLCSLDGATRDLIRRRGCVVVRGTFERAEAEAWNDELSDYLTRNDFFADLIAHDPTRAESGPGITPVYWSKPQIAARQHPRMVEVRTAINSLWDHGDRRWFDPDHDIGYADRVRWRPPGSTATGLPLHCDSPVTHGWREPENRRTFRHVLGGRPDLHDPWDAAHRTDVVERRRSSAVFRTFQGWTALDEMDPTDGVLQFVPVPLATAQLLVRGIGMELGLFGDPVPTPDRMRGGAAVAGAVVRIPSVRPGDTVWWHGDLLHGVEPATNRTRSSNVMYIPSSPRCPRNDAYNAEARGWFERGDSPSDFSPQHFERHYVGRATMDDLDAVGRRQLGGDPSPGLDRAPVVR